MVLDVPIGVSSTIWVYSSWTFILNEFSIACFNFSWTIDRLYCMEKWILFFSLISRYIFCVSGDFIKVYSTATEECVHILEGHRNLVTGIQLNPNNHLQLYSCSVDGTIKLWDYIDGILIKVRGLSFHFHYVKRNGNIRQMYFVLLLL